jgi:hypothetical protein
MSYDVLDEELLIVVHGDLDGVCARLVVVEGGEIGDVSLEILPGEKVL